MRTSRTATMLAAFLILASGTAMAAATPVLDPEAPPVHGIRGTIALDPLTSRGDFSVSDRVFEYRAVPVSGSPVSDDPRLGGRLESMWNWDLLADGSQPIPAWGTMRISVPPLPGPGGEEGPALAVSEEGAWDGTFTAIRWHDGEPFMARAFLIGEGAYEGLCAVLDIEAGTSAWTLDGVIHRLPMEG